MSSLSCEAGACSKPSPMHTAVGVHRLRGEAPWRTKVRQYFSTRGQHYGYVGRVCSGVMARSPFELCYHTFTRGGSGLAIGVPSPPCGGRLRPPTLSSYGVLGAPPNPLPLLAKGGSVEGLGLRRFWSMVGPALSDIQRVVWLRWRTICRIFAPRNSA